MMMRKALACLPVLLGTAGLAWGQTPGIVTSNGTTSVAAAPNPYVLADVPAAAAPTAGAPSPPDGSAPGGRFFGSAEYLLWWTEHSPLPPALITTGPVTAMPGALGNGGIPMTPGSLDEGAMSGARFGLGYWLDDGRNWGIEAGGFFLPRQTRTVAYSSDSSGNPVVAFRFLDPPVGGVSSEDAFVASVPAIVSAGPPQIGPYSGSVGLTTSTSLWGADANFLAKAWECEGIRWQLLAGFRYLGLDESLDLSFTRHAIPGSGAMVFFQGNPYSDPSSVSASDSFQTHNQFYGGQVGAKGEMNFGMFFFTFGGKLAIGDLHESLNIMGTSTLTQPGSPNVTVPGGLFAAASNIGHYTRDEFSVLPELELRVGCHISENIQVFVGYNLLYLNRVARPGSQFDQVVDTGGTVIDPGFTGATTTYPRPIFGETNFWAQGLDFGVQFSY